MAEEQTQPKPLSRSEREAAIKDKAGLEDRIRHYKHALHIMGA